MIPRRIFWLFDLAILGMAFFLAYAFVPGLHPFMVAGGLLSRWLQTLAVPADWSGVLPPRGELVVGSLCHGPRHAGGAGRLQRLRPPVEPVTRAHIAG